MEVSTKPIAPSMMLTPKRITITTQERDALMKLLEDKVEGVAWLISEIGIYIGSDDGLHEYGMPLLLEHACDLLRVGNALKKGHTLGSYNPVTGEVEHLTVGMVEEVIELIDNSDMDNLDNIRAILKRR